MTPGPSSGDAAELTQAAVASAADYIKFWLAYRRRYLRVPGIQAAVLFRDEIVLSCAFGDADREVGIPLRTDHLFRIASHSKTFTATAILQLAEAGRLRLDDPIGRWLPEREHTTSPVADVTVRELLSHSGGVIRDGQDADFWQLQRPFPDLPELLAMVGTGSAVLPPNERFKYSNVAYGLLGYVIQLASGRSYHDYVRDEIVDRLGLRNTGPEFDDELTEQYAVGYSALTYDENRAPLGHVNTGALAAATGFYSTAEDLCRYAAAHFRSDRRLLSERSQRVMQHEWWTIEGEPDNSYGLGLSILKVGDRRLLGHGGGYPGHITRTLFDPDAGLAVVVLTNAIDGPAEELAISAVKIVDHAARASRKDRDVLSGIADKARFCCRLANLWGVRDVALLGGQLFLLNPALADPTEACAKLTIVDDVTLRVAEDAGYGANGEPMRFDFDPGGTLRSVRGPGGMTWWPLADFRAPK